ncbi:MAG: hypothetical protein K1X55_13710 [Chitinophagales bacterium]|nr:hypothetical protein [Chitinophagales bacterium]
MKILFSIFFTICIAINIYFGIIDGEDMIWRHVFHILAYSICWISILKPFQNRRHLYFIASIYPISTHAMMLYKNDLSWVWILAFLLTIFLLISGNFFLRNETK